MTDKKAKGALFDNAELLAMYAGHSPDHLRGPNGLLLKLAAEGRLELFQLLVVFASPHQIIKSIPRRL